MINALNDEQRKKAILQSPRPGNNNLREAFKDNVVLDYAGLPASELSSKEQTAAARSDRGCTSTTWTKATPR